MVLSGMGRTPHASLASAAVLAKCQTGLRSVISWAGLLISSVCALRCLVQSSFAVAVVCFAAHVGLAVDLSAAAWLCSSCGVGCISECSSMGLLLSADYSATTLYSSTQQQCSQQ